MLALLPLSHFALGLLSSTGPRTARWLAGLGWCIGAALTAWFMVQLRGGAELMVGLGGWPAELGIGLQFDAVTASFAPLVLLLELAVLLYARNEGRRPLFYALLQFLLGAVFALLLAKDLFNEYVILELLTLVSFLLVAYERRPAQVWASLKYLILASAGMSLFLVGVAVVYRHTGTLNLGALAGHFTVSPQPPWLILAGTLLTAGVAVKAGMFAFAQWLPAAHAAAPSAISAILSGLVIKMGIVVIFRLSQLLPLGSVLQVLGAITALFGVVYAAYTPNLKRMLAFHTLSQIGYLVLGMAVGTPEALTGVLDYAIAHGLFKGLLFLAAGEARWLVGSERITDLIAERHRLPRATVGALLVGTLGIIGLPPLAGFGAKAVLLGSHPNTFVITVFALTSIGTAFSFSKLLPLLRFRRAAKTRSPHTAAYAVLALPVLLFLPFTHAIFPAVRAASDLRPLLVIESLAAIGLGLLLHRWVGRRAPRLPRQPFFLEEAMLELVIGVLLVHALLRF